LTIDLSSPTFAVKKSSKPYDQALIGIESTDPTFISNPDLLSGANYISKLALSGRVPTKVSTENGNIAPGDPLTSSSTPGVAMKATRSGPIVGKALESFTCDKAGPCQGKILVLVQTSYWVNFAEAPDYSLNSKADFVTKFITQAGEAVFSKITTAFAKVGKLVFGEIAVEKSSKSAGSGTINTGQTEVFISSNKVKADSLINLTPDSEPDGILYVKEKRVGEGFVVGVRRIDQNSAKGIKFNWFILNQE